MIHIEMSFAPKRALLFKLVAAAFLAAMLPAGSAAQEGSVSTLDALNRLKVGNERYVSGKLSMKDYKSERQKLVAGQHPYAIVLTCADSRVPPELLFDESLGKLFILRVAGNVVDPIVLGSIEYAAEHLHSGTLLVLGHESCGAVKATLAGGEAPPNIAALIKRIEPAAATAKKKNLDEKSTLSAAVEENVRLQMQNSVDQSALLREMVLQKKLWIAGGVYSLETGKVRFMPARVAITEHQAANEGEKAAPHH
jgi:carbonic anhydrase